MNKELQSKETKMIATENKVHCFEAAGLGIAPFRYMGMEYQEIAYGQRVLANGCTTKPGGTCDYCGTYIVNIFNVQSADGKKFHVGCECICKTGDEGLIKLVDRDVKEMDRKRRLEKKKAKIAADKLCCEENLKLVSGKLAQQVHPTKHRADQGETMLDYVKWSIENHYYENAARIIRKAMES